MLLSGDGFFEQVGSVRKSKKKAGGEAWLMSYSDLVTNLMAIFVLLFSMSTLDKSKFDAVSSAVTSRPTDNLATIKQRIDNEIKTRKLEGVVRTDLGFDGLRVVFQGSSMFESASSTLIPDSIKKVDPILAVVGSMDKMYQVSLEGHTDDVPLGKSARYSDNWALSSARGAALLAVLRTKGLPVERMNVGGYADTRPVQPVQNLQGEALKKARSLNRRVVVRIFQ
jgi:chemotaxis protein MotB